MSTHTTDYAQLAETLRALGIECDMSRDVRMHYATDESVFAVMPELIVFPKDTAQVQTLVRTVRELNQQGSEFSLTPRAAGTGLSGGSLNDSVIVDVMKYLTHIGEHSVLADGTAQISTQPGALFRDFDAHTKKLGFFLPPYPSSRDICTVGGMVANNAAGPDSLKYGHTARYVAELEVVLYDGWAHTLKPLRFDELCDALREDTALGAVYRSVWPLIEDNFSTMQAGRPASSKNSSGYAIWDVLQADSIESFKAGEGTFSLIPLFAGSQGTLGIITNIVFSVIPETEVSDVLVVPIQRIETLGEIVQSLLQHNPRNGEIFDDRTYRLARSNLFFFRKQFYARSMLQYMRFLFHFWMNELFAFKQHTPAFVLLVTFDGATKAEAAKELEAAYTRLHAGGRRVWRVRNTGRAEMFWKIRFASYSLAKLGKENRRPAAFLEDMVIPPQHLPEFLTELTKLLQTHEAEYAMHGHGGDGHFHFYPLLDFTDPDTPGKIKRMADECFALARVYKGNICGEHNDGIIRTPYLSQLFSQEILDTFVSIEHAFDPNDIFNPGKKVHPKFDIISYIRKTN